MRQFVTFCLKFLNYMGILIGFTSLRVDYSTQKVVKSKPANYYVVFANVTMVALLPCAHAVSINYITASFNNNLLAFTDSVNLFINYIVIVFSVVSRHRRENIYIEISDEVRKLDLTFFNKFTLNSGIEKRADWMLIIKIFTLSLVVHVPIYGVFQQAIRVDANVIMLAVYSSIMKGILHGVMFLFFFMLWLVRTRIWRLNAHLNDLLHRQLRLHGSTNVNLAYRSDVLLAAEELREMARVHARLIAMLQRLNAAYRWQVIAVQLTYLISNISYGYYRVATLNDSIYQHQTVPSLIASFVASTVVFLDINLLYWAADATTSACQHTASLLRNFQVLSFMDAAFEQQCETFALQLKQQNMHINIAGMFNLNRQTALALWAFCARHILILVQFDYEARNQGNGSSGVLEHVSRLLQFGEIWGEE
ncbi:putative gustatory receptor 36b [Anastrepha obliqua]|uniref:putative gustatory receptor 36b n=1 Tax=Anastrepha obliqua TaxID=95512 RepID=UPI00240A9959|nr:putative gustatory receptor 36b [Anastrepha obliqua]